MELDNIRDAIPYYLTKKAEEGLLLELEKFSDKTSFYTSREVNGLLQGDGWHGFSIYDFELDSKKTVKGLILSNSCDISSENGRDIPAKISFVPLIKYKKLEALFLGSSLDRKSSMNKLDAIRQQRSTSFFFLPAQTTLDEDYVAWLPDVHSVPLSRFSGFDHPKLFTLNMIGFYLFIFKLSIHFCRFHENLDRSPDLAH